MIVELEHKHNHPINAADALRHRDVSETVADKLLDLIKQGYSPSKALELHKYDLQMEYGDDYVLKCADRFICPDLQFCFRLYYKAFKSKYGEPKGEQLLKMLESKLEQYNSDTGQKSAESRVVGERDVAVAIVTPLMRRVHELIKHSAELVFIDASGNMDHQSCRVFLILTHSCAGGLPLGVLITTSESTETITSALELYNSFLDDKAFYGRGPSPGPQLIMTDDSAAERQALQAMYPEAILLLCVFHVLQAFWRFLWDSKNSVRKEDRPSILMLLKAMVYADSVDPLEEKYEAAVRNPVLRRYENVAKHLEGIYGRRKEWAICHRSDLRVRNNDTNNYAEAAMRVLKDQILDITRAYNVIQLADFMMTRLESYFERRLLDICNNRLDRASYSRFLPHTATGKKIDEDRIVQTSEMTFTVPSETDSDATYTVDMTIGACTCRLGKTGGPCKHQFLVVKKYGLSSWNFIPVHDSSMRRLIYQVATGSSTPPTEEWFQSLRRPLVEVLPQVNNTIEEAVEVDQSAQVDIVEEMVPVRLDHADDAMESEGQPPADMEHKGFDSSSMASLTLQRTLQNRFDMRGLNRPHPSTTNSDQGLPAGSTLLNDLKGVFSDFEERYRANPEYFEKPLRTFVRQAESLTTNSALVSALVCFGKYSGAGTAMGKRKVKGMVSCKTIGVQPTALARRKVMGGTKHRLGSGRPCKLDGKENVKPKKRKQVVVPLSSQVLPRLRII
ncbi:uncharacterized protein LOC135489974 isoform X2 [Lineus longissimus]